MSPISITAPNVGGRTTWSRTAQPYPSVDAEPTVLPEVAPDPDDVRAHRAESATSSPARSRPVPLMVPLPITRSPNGSGR